MVTTPSRCRNRSNYVALNVVPTSPSELSIYYRSGDRYVLRTNGFISSRSVSTLGELPTKPGVFGNELLTNSLPSSSLQSLLRHK
jgi:hypothetical protein